MKKIKFAIPKGHLELLTLKTLERAGYEISGKQRTYSPIINDPAIDLKFLRPQEIPIFVSKGLQDIGITGLDWLIETHANVTVLLNLEYSKVKLVMAIPKAWSSIKNCSDLVQTFNRQKKILRISTEYLNISQEFLKSNSIYLKLYGNSNPTIITPWLKSGKNEKVEIYLSFGATEAKPPENADAIIEVSETGTSLESNKLKIVETLMESNAQLIANKKAMEDPFKREKIYDIFTLIKGVVDARKKVHIFVNVSSDNLQPLLNNLQALKKPTISPLSDKKWFSVNTVIEKEYFLKIIPILRKLAQGIVVYEPRQVLPFDEISSREKENGL